MLLRIFAIEFEFVEFSSERMRVEIGLDRVFEARDDEAVRRGERSCSRKIGSAMYVQGKKPGERSCSREDRADVKPWQATKLEGVRWFEKGGSKPPVGLNEVHRHIFCFLVDKLEPLCKVSLLGDKAEINQHPKAHNSRHGE